MASSSHASDEPPQSGSASPQDVIELRIEAGVLQAIDLPWLRDYLMQSAQQVSLAASRAIDRIEVVVVNDAQMTDLHRKYLGINSSTDVLSFDLAPDQARGDAPAPITADIAVCADEAARKAAELGHPIEQELLLYALHGVLHCAGFDDLTDEGYRAMHALEDRILQAIGIKPTFHASSTQSRPSSGSSST